MTKEKRRASITPESGDGDAANDLNTETGRGHAADAVDPATQPDHAEGITAHVETADNADASYPKSIADEDLAGFGPNAIDGGLAEQRDAEKVVFHNLIEENVKVTRAKKSVEVDLLEMVARYDLKMIELDEERAKSEKLESKINEMEKDMKLLVLKYKKSMRDGSSAKESNFESDDNTGTENDNQNNNSGEKVKDLQHRLIRLAKDDAAKDTHIQSLQEEKLDLQALLLELEKHIEPEKVKDIEAAISMRREESKKQNQTNLVVAKGVTHTSAGTVNESRVCSVM